MRCLARHVGHTQKSDLVSDPRPVDMIHGRQGSRRLTPGTQGE